MAAPLYPITVLDYEQVIQNSYDESIQGLRTSATATISGDIAVDIDAATGDNIALASPDGSLKVSVTTALGKNGLDVNVIGGTVTANVSMVGLDGGVKHTRLVVGDTIPVEVTANLAATNSTSIRVVGNSAIYFGDSSVTGETGGNPGYPKFFHEEIILDIKNTATTKLYAICDTGQSGELAIIQI